VECEAGAPVSVEIVEGAHLAVSVESERGFVQHAVGAARDLDYAFLALDFEPLGIGIVVSPQSHLQRQRNIPLPCTGGLV
jgi:hypothetical protein